MRNLSLAEAAELFQNIPETITVESSGYITATIEVYKGFDRLWYAESREGFVNTLVALHGGKRGYYSYMSFKDAVAQFTKQFPKLAIVQH